jgi:hypothetical protein
VGTRAVRLWLVLAAAVLVTVALVSRFVSRGGVKGDGRLARDSGTALYAWSGR